MHPSRLLLLLLSPLFAACVTATPPKDNGVDDDGDGFTTVEDCDDTTDAIFPGAPESCNGVDDDCDGATDETGASGEGTFYLDADGDGHGTLTATASACTAPEGFAASSDDCDDANLAVYPGAPEHCDAADENCNDEIDEDAVDAPSWYDDLDGDYHGAGAAVVACEGPEGRVAVGDDCDDTNPSLCPGNEEHCDGVDENCDGLGDAESVDAIIWYADTDADGFGDVGNVIAACDVPEGYLADATDCDDTADSIFPGALEYCDGVLQNCGGVLDEDAEDALTWYADADSDTFGDASATARGCEAPAGYVADATDCNDGSDQASPVGTEACDTLDNDCDGDVDESGATGEVAVFLDADADGYGVATSTVYACAAAPGYSTLSTDCDDTDDATHPNADEHCGGADENCDGDIDEDAAVDAAAWYGDADLDTYGGGTPTYSCVAPAGSVASSTDCDDSSNVIHPGATELCNGTDTNCSGDETDATNARLYYADADADTYGNPDASTRDCSAPSGYVSNDDDCDDVEIDVNPGETEVCDNGLDDDCDGTSNGCAPGGYYTNTYSYDAVTYVSYETNFGSGVKAAVDADHDGDADLLMAEGSYTTKVWLVPGPIAAGTSTLSGGSLSGSGSDYFGTRISNVGDVDLDGFDEFLIGAPYALAYDGAAYLWYSAVSAGDTTASADAVFEGDSGCGLGAQYTGGAGDTDGDGLTEVLMSGDDGVMSRFDGVPAGTLSRGDAATEFSSSTAGDTAFGVVAADPGDVDGDGYDDLFVGTNYGGTGQGAVYQLNGPFGSTVDGATAYAARFLPAGTSYTGFVLDAAEVTGDGEVDLVAISTDTTTTTGYRFDLYAGPFGGTILSSSADASLSNFTSTSASGDVDGDGTNDVVFGTQSTSTDYGPGWQLSYVGAGGSLAADASAYGRNSGGSSLAPGYNPILADVNDDGFDDVVTGVQSDDSGGSSGVDRGDRRGKPEIEDRGGDSEGDDEG